ncbi:MAG TPA: 3-hydroxyacyl-CoA dehydrogenase NAD-binding domain-containing protein [Solirubrobacterales bacterium]|nr:3-hydroxyacyl-CoA dehydrogenase NAD-binding domain-containing protein [Solirubrobacterales bacterium]
MSAGRLTIERIGVVGAGTMGTGIALLSCLGRYATSIHDPDEAVLSAAQTTIGEALAEGADKRWTADEAEAASGRLRAAESLADLAGSDLVIEAAPEDLALKRRLFADLGSICGPETILATNTSSLRVAEIAAGAAHPEAIVGMHFFNPPVLMQLVEVVATEASSTAMLVAATEVAKEMGRTPIRAKDSPGFVANRLARPFSLESLRMLADGLADAPTIDRVVRIGGGFRMGPFELLDLIGLDVNLTIGRSLYEQGGRPERWRPSPIQERMVAEGRLGRKCGLGFYEYGTGRHRERDPDLGIEGPTLGAEELRRIDPAGPEIMLRLTAQIANEAAYALADEVASPADMNTAMRLGFNWPLGPLEFTGMIGADRAAALLDELRERLGDAYVPAPGLT